MVVAGRNTNFDWGKAKPELTGKRRALDNSVLSGAWNDLGSQIPCPTGDRRRVGDERNAKQGSGGAGILPGAPLI